MADRRVQHFRDGYVLTGPGRFERASLLVAGGRVVEVVPGRGRAIPHGGVTDVDLRGLYVIPGFVDAHFHLRALAAKRLRCDLSQVASADEVAEVLRAFAASHPGEGPVMGVDWDESGWDDESYPTCAMLDAVSRRRPLLARRVCGHVGVVNTAFLERLAPFGRFIDRESGRVTEDALWAANAVAAPERGALAAAFGGAVAELHALGITAIHDIVTPADVDTYLAGVAGATAPLRIEALVVGTPADLAAVRSSAEGLVPERFRAVGVKCFADGSLGGHTAALREPYADADGRGDLLLDEDTIAALARRCADAGVTCAVHAIGDRAVDTAVGAAERVPEAALRVEHAEVLDAALVDRIAAAGVRLCMQPNFVRNWGGEGGLYERRLGPARRAMTNPFRVLESRGVDFVFGSDGMPPGPLFGLSGATRHPVEGMSIGAASALSRYTGRLGRDAPADLVALSGDPLLADPDRLAVEATWVGGQCVYRRARRRRNT